MQWVKRAIWLPALAATLALLASFLGNLHPGGDSLAVIRLHLVAAVLLAALLLMALRARHSPVLAALALLALAVTLRPQFIASAANAPHATVYQKNLSFRLSDPAPLIADIRAARPDILTLQEVTEANKAVLAAVAADLPTQQFCAFARVGGVAVASRWPAVPGTAQCAGRNGLAAVQVQTPDGPLWLVSLHLHWPWPHGQARQVARLLPVLDGFDGPVIVGGDFNMVPWASSVARLARASGTRVHRHAQGSFPRFEPWLPLPIDHVLADRPARPALRGGLGSDHLGLLVTVGYEATGR